jgi:hypothetical protein
MNILKVSGTIDSLDFSSLPIGEKFYFPISSQAIKGPYTKVEETRRPYTPEAFSNALREDGVYFYVTPTSKVISQSKDGVYNVLN